MEDKQAVFHISFSLLDVIGKFIGLSHDVVIQFVKKGVNILNYYYYYLLII